jgi:tetratricopeptide (TPR) repeat protein
VNSLSRALAVAFVLALSGCASFGALAPPGSLRISELQGEGDPQRRSSLDLVLQGLDADAEGQSAHALSEYQAALRVDPSNPWVYLALARHHAATDSPQRALPFLDKAESLLGAEGASSPRVEAHLVGLRGAALAGSGRRAQGAPLLERASELAPSTWGDGALDAAELR